MTEDQWVEIIEEVVAAHISRDSSVCEEDQQWETRNLARALSFKLRFRGFRIPEIPK